MLKTLPLNDKEFIPQLIEYIREINIRENQSYNNIGKFDNRLNLAY